MNREADSVPRVTDRTPTTAGYRDAVDLCVQRPSELVRLVYFLLKLRDPFYVGSLTAGLPESQANVVRSAAETLGELDVSHFVNVEDDLDEACDDLAGDEGRQGAFEAACRELLADIVLLAEALRLISSLAARLGYPDFGTGQLSVDDVVPSPLLVKLVLREHDGNVWEKVRSQVAALSEAEEVLPEEAPPSPS